jgi:chaperonin cofactor prefoldin
MISNQICRLEKDSEKLMEHIKELKQQGDHELAAKVQKKLDFLQAHIKELS